MCPPRWPRPHASREQVSLCSLAAVAPQELFGTSPLQEKSVVLVTWRAAQRDYVMEGGADVKSSAGAFSGACVQCSELGVVFQMFQMITFAAFFNRYRESGINHSTLGPSARGPLVCHTLGFFPSANRWMCSMLKKARGNTRRDFGREPRAWLQTSLPQFLLCPSTPPCSLVSANE